MSSFTVEIIIAAFNEEKTIGQLLNSLLQQQMAKQGKLKIVVYSDMSTDQTDTIIKNYGEKVTLRRTTQRTGKSGITSAAMKRSRAEVLVVLDADIVLGDEHFISKLVEPILEGRAELTSAQVVPLKPDTFTEKVLTRSTVLKDKVFSKLKNGQSLYTCHGRARAFSSQIYTNMELPNEIIADEAFSYLWTIAHSYSYNFVGTAACYYRLPTTVRDHLKQSRRFLIGKTQLTEYFDKDLLQQEYYIPKALTLKTVLAELFSDPLSVMAYAGLFILSWTTTQVNSEESSTWQSVPTSKNIQKAG